MNTVLMNNTTNNSSQNVETSGNPPENRHTQTSIISGALLQQQTTPQNQNLDVAATDITAASLETTKYKPAFGLTKEELIASLDQYPNITDLDLSEYRHLKIDFHLEICAKCPRLESFRFAGPIEDDSIHYFFKHNIASFITGIRPL